MESRSWRSPTITAVKTALAVVEVAKELPIDLIPGMELCTSEEVHVICLFGQLEQAMAFDAYVHDHLPPVKNRPGRFLASSGF